MKKRTLIIIISGIVLALLIILLCFLFVDRKSKLVCSIEDDAGSTTLEYFFNDDKVYKFIYNDTMMFKSETAANTYYEMFKDSYTDEENYEFKNNGKSLTLNYTLDGDSVKKFDNKKNIKEQKEKEGYICK